jgi:hypothetical protein
MVPWGGGGAWHAFAYLDQFGLRSEYNKILL